MKPEDKKKENGNPSPSDKDKKYGRGNPHGRKDKDGRSDEDKYIEGKSFIPSDDQVSAVSAVETVESISSTVLAVLNTGMKSDYLFDKALENHRDDIKAIVKKRAALYFSVLAPTTINDIISKVYAVITNSLTAFANICYLWKIQNAQEFEDEDGYNLMAAINNGVVYGERVSVDEVPATGYQNKGFFGTWTISNAEWKRDFLKGLRNAYLSDKAMEFLYTMVGHYIMFEYEDESDIRLWNIIPSGLGAMREVSEDYPTKAQFLTAYNVVLDAIDAAFNSYPFMEDILNDLGLYHPGEKYDFTRDLAATRLNVLQDRDHALENLCYLVCNDVHAPISGVLAGTKQRFVTADKLQSVIFTFYDKEGGFAASKLKYLNRVVAQTKSLTNAMRGCCQQALNITYIMNIPGTGKKTYFVPPYSFRLSSTTGMTVANIEVLLSTNNIITFLDMPNDLVHIGLGANALTSDTYGLKITGTWAFELQPQGGDYIIDANDINSVTSDACAEYLFRAAPLAPVAQTLGNSGK